MNKPLDIFKYLDYQYPGITDYLYRWVDGDINEMRILNLPPEDEECDESWSYFKGILTVILKEIPDFETITWVDTDIFKGNLFDRFGNNFDRVTKQTYKEKK